MSSETTPYETIQEIVPDNSDACNLSRSADEENCKYHRRLPWCYPHQWTYTTLMWYAIEWKFHIDNWQICVSADLCVLWFHARDVRRFVQRGFRVWWAKRAFRSRGNRCAGARTCHNPKCSKTHLERTSRIQDIVMSVVCVIFMAYTAVVIVYSIP